MENKKIGSKKEKKITLSFKEYEELKERARLSEERWDRLLRLQAEFENAKKRMERERVEFMRFANEEIIADLLSIVDDLERAIHTVKNSEHSSSFLKGLELILGRLKGLLKENGLKEIEAMGKPFDPIQHEAVMQVESEDEPEGIIVEELQRGYLLNDRVLRPAKVKVVAAKTQKNSTPQNPQKT